MVIDNVKVQENQGVRIDKQFSEKALTSTKEFNGGKDKGKTKNVEEKFEKLAEALQKFLEKFNLVTKVVFEKKYDSLVVKVYDRDSGKLIRQIPPEELLEVYKRIEELVGILYRKKI